MKWSDHGFLVAAQSGTCCDEGTCLKVCPFNPDERDPARNEDGLGQRFLPEATHSDPQLGRYIGLYAGHASQHRLNASSGGLATHVFDALLRGKWVEHIVSVGPSETEDSHYTYVVTSQAADLPNVAKTKYYPVTLAEALMQIRQLPGRVAVSGVACFVKALRLAQTEDPALKEKIPFVVGIICGGVKSSFFTDYLATKAGASLGHVGSPDYRVKNERSSAGDYAFSCTDLRVNTQKSVRMQSLGDMWGTGLFKANACDFCDDVMTELADISLGDAWIQPFSRDGRGNSVIVTRSNLAETLMREGMQSGALALSALSQETMVSSQQGSFNHRHDGLYARVQARIRRRLPTPAKRHGHQRVLPDVWLVQRLRSLSRARSLKAWHDQPDAEAFDAAMQPTLQKLRLATRLLNYRKALVRRWKGLLK